ncbi:unnamed protein product [Dicrocoelium dendriticum]|nr:unnamed protein product [Dicrocoelium dendriticum]
MTKRRSRIACMHIPGSNSASFGSPNHNAQPNFPTLRGVSPVRLSSKTLQAISVSCPTLNDECTTTGLNPLPSMGNATFKPRYTVLFSHGNAVDIGQMAGFLQSLAYRFGVDIVCYDYSGYGVSTGLRLEENLYADAEAVLHEVRERYEVPLERIVLYGQSIGTAPTVYLATKYKVAGVVLHSPFMSGLRVVCPGTTRRFCFDPFTNIDKVSQILSPTLIIHGTDDEIIGIHHGRELFSRLTHPLEPAWIDGAGHNDIELFSEYAARLDRFFNEDLAASGGYGDSGDECFVSTTTVELCPRRSPKHFSLKRSEFTRNKTSNVPDTICNRSPTLQHSDSSSTLGTPDNSESQLSSNSVEDARITTKCDPEPARYHAVRSNTIVACVYDKHAIGSTDTHIKRRVWTMRKESTVNLSEARLKVVHNSLELGNTNEPKHAMHSVHEVVPGDVIPRFLPLEALAHTDICSETLDTTGEETESCAQVRSVVYPSGSVAFSISYVVTGFLTGSSRFFDSLVSFLPIAMC